LIAVDLLARFCSRKKNSASIESSDVVQILAHNLQLPNVNNYDIQKFLLAQREEHEQKQVKSEEKLFNISRLP
jgi:hypothetical protein